MFVSHKPIFNLAKANGRMFNNTKLKLSVIKANKG